VLISDTVRARRTGIIVWVTGGAVFMLVVAYGYVVEVDQYPGGAPAMGAAIEAAAQAMRLLRWPAERLDTFGGYITYHNVTILALFLSIWAAIQGAYLLRGSQAEGPLEQILATERSRRSVAGYRVAGFVVVLTLIVAGIGVGLAVATAVAGVYDPGGAMLTMVSAGLSALVCFGLGLAVAQLAGTARVAAGLSAAIITGLYLVTNVWEQLGGSGAIRFVSPFHYSNQSRALVPGQSATLWAMGVLIAMTLGVTAIAAWAFNRRDIGSPLWARKPRTTPREAAEFDTGSPRPYWRAESVRHRLELLGWSAGMATLTGLMAWLQPVVADLWEQLGFTQFMSAADSGASVVDQYMSFAAELAAAVVAGFGIAQATGWVAEMRDGRVELYLAHPVSWRRLILERLVTMTAGVAAIAVGAILGLSIGAVAVDAPLDPAGLVRTVLGTILLGLALGGVGAVLVAWLRTGISVILLTAATFASYLLAFVVPLFDLPKWLASLSFFGAYGRPYLEAPDVAGLGLLMGLAVVGILIAPVVAGRRPKVR